MGRIFGVDDFGQQKFGKSLVFFEKSARGQRGPEHGHGLGPGYGHGVTGTGSGKGADHDENVLKLRFQIGYKGFGVRFLKNDGDYRGKGK